MAEDVVKSLSYLEAGHMSMHGKIAQIAILQADLEVIHIQRSLQMLNSHLQQAVAWEQQKKLKEDIYIMQRALDTVKQKRANAAEEFRMTQCAGNGELLYDKQLAALHLRSMILEAGASIPGGSIERVISPVFSRVSLTAFSTSAEGVRLSTEQIREKVSMEGRTRIRCAALKLGGNGVIRFLAAVNRETGVLECSGIAVWWKRADPVRPAPIMFPQPYMLMPPPLPPRQYQKQKPEPKPKPSEKDAPYYPWSGFDFYPQM